MQGKNAKGVQLYKLRKATGSEVKAYVSSKVAKEIAARLVKLAESPPTPVTPAAAAGDNSLSDSDEDEPPPPPPPTKRKRTESADGDTHFLLRCLVSILGPLAILSNHLRHPLDSLLKILKYVKEEGVDGDFCNGQANCRKCKAHLAVISYVENQVSLRK
jgi:hypothetical protein